MATEVIKIVDPDNGPGTDYISLAAWNAGEQRDLVAADEIAVATCRCSAGSADTSRLIFSGWTRDADHYVKIWTDPAESYRHAGVWDDTKFRIETYSDTRINTYVIFDGIQLLVAPGSPRGLIVYSGEGVRNCVFRGPGDGTAEGVLNASKVFDCIFLSFQTGISHGYFPLYAYNCTFIDCGVGISRTGGNHIFKLKNCLFSGCTADMVADTGTQRELLNCATDIAESSSGLNIPEASNIRYSQTFAFVDAANGNYALASTDTGAKDYGADLSADLDLSFTTDIAGNLRVAPWDIGAFEYISASGGTDALIATGITAGDPALGTPVIGQTHSLIADSITSGSPAIVTAALGQVHTLSANTITTPAPALGTPSLAESTDALTATGITAQAPTLGTPAISQTHVLAGASIVTQAPLLDAPDVGQIHALAAANITAQTPVLGAPSMTPSIGLSATGITAGVPVFGAPSIGQIQALVADATVAQAPVLASAALGQTHALTALAVLAGAPALGTPGLGMGGATTPASRRYAVKAEYRTYLIAAENRTYLIAAENRTYLIAAENKALTIT